MCSTSLEDFVHFFGFPEGFIPRILKQKNENYAKLQGVEGKRGYFSQSHPRFWEELQLTTRDEKKFYREKKKVFFFN